MSSSLGLMRSAMRVLLGVGGLASIGIAAGVGSVCGCPANCSPVVCVDISNCVATNPAPPEYGECVFSVCTGGYEWSAPGPTRIEETTAGDLTCGLWKGTVVNGQCVFNPWGEEIGTHTVPAVTGIKSKECE